MSRSRSPAVHRLPSSSLQIVKAPLITSHRLSSTQLAGITSSILGVQVSWSVLMAHGNPYLQSLGFSSALTSLVWLAGPLSGTIVQPLVGMWSDEWRVGSSSRISRLGRRKPFILTGAILTFISFLALANVRELLGLLAFVMGLSPAKIERGLGLEGDAVWVVKLSAIFWVYALNLAIQPLQVGVRAYVIDSAPSEQQMDASAWIGRWNSFGAVLAFWLGSLDLPAIFPILGSSQFQILGIIDGVVLLVTIPVSFLAGSSSQAMHTRASAKQRKKQNIVQVWKQLHQAWTVMPGVSWQVCKVQFWAWMAWFPFLYYNTMYVGSFRSVTAEHSSENTSGPAVITSTNGAHIEAAYIQAVAVTQPNSVSTAAQAGSFAAFLFALTSLVFTFVLPPTSRYSVVLTVPRLWMIAHVAFAVITSLTVFARDITDSTFLVASLGFCWAMTQWAPYALISKEISKLGNEDAEDAAADIGSAARDNGGAGAILGLHNVAIAGPQVIAAIECSLLFGFFDHIDLKDKIGWVIRLTSLTALMAAFACRGLVSRFSSR